MLTLIWNFISYWYFRYLLVTELYMVEKWERAMFHIVIFLLVAIAYTFNTTVILGLVRFTTNYLSTSEDLIEVDNIGAVTDNF